MASKENRELARERRARERKKKERIKALKIGAVILAITLAIVLMFVVISIGSSTEETVPEEQTVTETAGKEVVENGDTINLDYVGYIDGVAFDGGNTNGAGTDLTIGSHTYIDDFEEQLIGHKVGEEVDVVVTFPDDYGAEDLAGKEATFECVINSIY